jgi:hypothetical protein
VTRTPLVDGRKDKKIAEAVGTIGLNGSPLKDGERPVLSGVHSEVGDTYNVSDGTLIDTYGNAVTDFAGTLCPIAYISVDQNGSVIEKGKWSFCRILITKRIGSKPMWKRFFLKMYYSSLGFRALPCGDITVRYSGSLFNLKAPQTVHSYR